MHLHYCEERKYNAAAELKKKFTCCATGTQCSI